MAYTTTEKKELEKLLAEIDVLTQEAKRHPRFTIKQLPLQIDKDLDALIDELTIPQSPPEGFTDFIEEFRNKRETERKRMEEIREVLLSNKSLSKPEFDEQQKKLQEIYYALIELQTDGLSAYKEADQSVKEAIDGENQIISTLTEYYYMLERELAKKPFRAEKGEAVVAEQAQEMKLEKREVKKGHAHIMREAKFMEPTKLHEAIPGEVKEAKFERGQVPSGPHSASVREISKGGSLSLELDLAKIKDIMSELYKEPEEKSTPEEERKWLKAAVPEIERGAAFIGAHKEPKPTPTSKTQEKAEEKKPEHVGKNIRLTGIIKRAIAKTVLKALLKIRNILRHISSFLKKDQPDMSIDKSTKEVIQKTTEQPEYKKK